MIKFIIALALIAGFVGILTVSGSYNEEGDDL